MGGLVGYWVDWVHGWVGGLLGNCIHTWETKPVLPSLHATEAHTNTVDTYIRDVD